jgi:DNA repair exonuclease SbcCD nuclease subunit
MSKILHISDTHLGRRQYGSDTRRQDFIDGFAAGIERAIENDVDAIVHTGDLFDSREPPLPDVTRCIDILRRAADAEIPFYAIVGNHESKLDSQWLDLIERTGTASRLGRSPTMVGEDFAVYGIDAVSSPAWESMSFELDPPPNEDAYCLLCMHQLLDPPVPEIMADYATEEVIERLSIDIDGLALGDYHEPESDRVKGVDVWYAGSTERTSKDELGPRSVTLLEREAGKSATRQHLDVDARPFRLIDIAFRDEEGYAHARSEIESHDIADAAVIVTLTGKRTSLTSTDVEELVDGMGAAVVSVDDDRGREDLDLDALDSPSAAVEDPDSLIESRIAEAGLSTPALAVEEEVRGGRTATQGLADEGERLVTEAQEAAFADGEANPTPPTGETSKPAEEASKPAADEANEPTSEAAEAAEASTAAEADNGGTGTAGGTASGDDTSPMDNGDDTNDMDDAKQTIPEQGDVPMSETSGPEDAEQVGADPDDAAPGDTESNVADSDSTGPDVAGEPAEEAPSESPSPTPESETTDSSGSGSSEPSAASGSSESDSSSGSAQASFADLGGSDDDSTDESGGST